MTVDDTLQTRPLYGGAASLAFPQRFVDISDFRPIPDHQEARPTGPMQRCAVQHSWPPPPPLPQCARLSSCCCRPLFTLQVFADASLDQSLTVEIVVRTRTRWLASCCTAAACGHGWYAMHHLDPPRFLECSATLQEHQAGVADGEAAAFFFQDQAQHNDAAHAQIDEARERPGMGNEGSMHNACGDAGTRFGAPAFDRLLNRQVMARTAAGGLHISRRCWCWGRQTCRACRPTATAAWRWGSRR